jgi:hypothetical protein
MKLRRFLKHEPKRGFSRRKLLEALGISAGLAPLLPLLNASAQSTTGSGPKRLLLLYSPDGIPAADWNDSLNWRPSGGATDFTFHELHSPLQPYRSKVVVPWGMSMTVAGAGEAHAHGMAGCWSACRLKGPGNGADFDGGNGNRTGWGSGASIDQVLAQNFGPEMPYQVSPSDPAQQTRFRTLELGVDAGNPTSLNRMIYRGDDEPLNPEDDPSRAFDTIFEGVSPAGEEPTVDLEAERTRAEQQALLDVDRASLNKIRSKVGTLDYDKIDRHLESLLELEQSLNVPTGQPTDNCSIPEAREGNFPTEVEAMMNIIASTFACDLTRIMSLQMSHGFSNIAHGSWAAGAGSTGHHTYAHNGNDDTVAQTQIDKWYCSQVAYLVGLLDSIPEGEGSVLDSTLICWGRELGNTAHQFYDYPGIMIGGAAGALSTGRNLDVSGSKHVQWLVSILNLMGLDTNTVGNIEPGSGPLPGLI